MVNLQDSKEFASQVLNRDIWSNHNIKDLVREHFLFLQVGVASSVGLQVCTCSQSTRELRPGTFYDVHVGVGTRSD